MAKKAVWVYYDPRTNQMMLVKRPSRGTVNPRWTCFIFESHADIRPVRGKPDLIDGIRDVFTVDRKTRQKFVYLGGINMGVSKCK